MTEQLSHAEVLESTNAAAQSFEMVVRNFVAALPARG